MHNKAHIKCNINYLDGQKAYTDLPFNIYILF